MKKLITKIFNKLGFVPASELKKAQDNLDFVAKMASEGYTIVVPKEKEWIHNKSYEHDRYLILITKPDVVISNTRINGYVLTDSRAKNCRVVCCSFFSGSVIHDLSKYVWKN